MAEENWTTVQIELLTQLNAAVQKTRGQRADLIVICDKIMRFYAELGQRCVTDRVLKEEYGRFWFNALMNAANESVRQLKYRNMNTTIGWQLRDQLVKLAGLMHA
jgi:hypothetical protein